MSSHNLRGHIYHMLAGREPLPEQYMVGKSCVNGHGVDGMAIRYSNRRENAKYGECVLCNIERGVIRQRRKKSKITEKEKETAKRLRDYESREKDLFLI